MLGPDMQSQHGICNNSVNSDFSITDSVMANNLPFFNSASVPWPEYAEPTLVGTADLTPPSIDPDHYAPDVAIDQDPDWN